MQEKRKKSYADLHNSKKSSTFAVAKVLENEKEELTDY